MNEIVTGRENMADFFWLMLDRRDLPFTFS